MFAPAVGGKAGIVRFQRSPRRGVWVVVCISTKGGPMRKAAILAVAVGVLTFAIASTAGSAPAAESGSAPTSAPDRELRHILGVNKALKVAFQFAAERCFQDPICIAYGASNCSRVGRLKHKVACTVHRIVGVPGDQAQQQDCHVRALLSYKNFGGRTVFVRPTGADICGPNVEHPGFRGLRTR
jgi:hypothetical protein